VTTAKRVDIDRPFASDPPRWETASSALSCFKPDGFLTVLAVSISRRMSVPRKQNLLSQPGMPRIMTRIADELPSLCASLLIVDFPSDDMVVLQPLETPGRSTRGLG
jgi:hypothetical protein